MTTVGEIRAALDGVRLRWNSDGSPCWCLRELGHTAGCATAHALIASLPADGVIVTPASLARALHRDGERGGWCNPWATGPNHTTIHEVDAAAILAALAAEGGPA